MPVTERCKILSRSLLNENTMELLLDAPAISSGAQPGQFVNVACGPEHLLRRPISICNCNDHVLTLVFEVRGKGTQWLFHQECGAELDLLGPLGHGFAPSAAPERTLLVGGGVGTAPLLYLAHALKGKCGVICGFRSEKQVILKTDFSALSQEFVLCTDDGSEGERGTVCVPLERLLASGKYDQVLCCGPKPMMRAVAGCCRSFEISCQVSLEERMGCGVGACLVCACKIQRAGTQEFLHVCKDGPVFNAEEVVFE